MKKTLQDRLLQERIADVDRQLNESDEDVLRQLAPKLRRLEKIANNLGGIASVTSIIQAAKQEAIAYAEKGSMKRGVNWFTGGNAIKKIDKLSTGLKNLLGFVQSLGAVVPEIKDGEEHDSKALSLIRRGLGKVKGNFLDANVKEELYKTLSHLTPKQMKSFGKRPLNLSKGQSAAIQGTDPDELETGDSEKPKPTDKPKPADDPKPTNDPKDTEKEQVDPEVIKAIKQKQLELLAKFTGGHMSMQDYVAAVTELLADKAGDVPEQEPPKETPKEEPQGGGGEAPSATDDI